MTFEFVPRPKPVAGTIGPQSYSLNPSLTIPAASGSRFTKRKSEFMTETDTCDIESPQSMPFSTLDNDVDTEDNSALLRPSISSKQRPRLLENEDDRCQDRAYSQAIHYIESPVASTGDIIFSEYGLHPTSVSGMSESESVQAQLDSDIVEEDVLVHRIRELSSSHELEGQLEDEQVPELEQELEQEQTREQLLAAARNGKRVIYHREAYCPRVLPNEILIQVFERLVADQQTLRGAASVCVDWNLCATVFLYRYPTFASTLHWALFIQTLCRAKETKRPKARRRRSIIQSLSRAREFGAHPPSQLAPAQIEVYGGRAHWSHSRLDHNLGEFVRGIDLSRKTTAVDQVQTTTAKPQDLSIGNKPRSPRETFSFRCRTTTPNDSSNQKTKPRTKQNLLGSNDNMAILPGLNKQRPGQAGSNLIGRPPLTQLNSNPASNQRWSILWSMENQYRKSTGNNRFTTTSSPQPSTATSSNRYDYNVWGHSHLNASSFSQLNLATSTRQLAASSLFNDDEEEEEQGDVDDVPATTEKKTETKEIRYKKSITITVSSIIQMARHCPNLVSLCLGSSLTPDTLYLETGDYQSTLQPGPRSGLTYVPVTIADGAKALGEYCPKLQKLWLAGCDWVTAVEVQNFSMCCRQLQTLDLRHCSKLDGRLAQLFIVEDEPGETVGASGDYRADDDSDDEISRYRTKRDSVNMTTLLGGSQVVTDDTAGLEAPWVADNRAILNMELGAADSASNLLQSFSNGRSSSSVTITSDSRLASSSPVLADSPPPTELNPTLDVGSSITYKPVRDGAMCELVNIVSNGRVGKGPTENQQQGTVSTTSPFTGGQLNHENIDYSDENDNGNEHEDYFEEDNSADL
ncbi:hypothetical protein BGX27_001103 [Mortierella sp. AM989]|nr:hypothetical protein BGX27_001103 [Mortierella sp. AM989]